MLTTFLILLAIALIVGALISLCDIHIAVYRPKVPGRTTYFYTEVGNQETSQLNVPPPGEE
jgi:hypothetical protein